MVVDEDEPGRADPDRIPEELADPHQRRGHVALVDGLDAQDVVLRVEQDDAQLLALEAAHLEDEPIGDVARSTDRPAPGRPVGEQPTTKFERRDQLRGADRADPRQARQLEFAGASQPRQVVVRVQTVYQGNVSASLVRVGELFRDAVRVNAAGLILVHNHPSGDPTPSPDDLHLTAEALAAGRLLDIALLDHLVIGHDAYESLRDRGVAFDRPSAAGRRGD